MMWMSLLTVMTLMCCGVEVGFAAPPRPVDITSESDSWMTSIYNGASTEKPDPASTMPPLCTTVTQRDPNDNAIVGFDLELVCMETINCGEKDTAYEWQVNRTKISETTDYILRLKGLSIKDNGDYTCSTGESGFGNPYTLTVGSQPEVAMSASVLGPVTKDTSVTITCKVTPTASEITWSLDGKKLDDLLNKTKYEIARPNNTHQGLYQCKATNNIGTAYGVHNLIVLYAPIGAPDITPRKSSILVNTTHRLTCTTGDLDEKEKGYPIATRFEWKKNGIVMIGADNREIEREWITLNETSVKEAIHISCGLQNMYGSTENPAELTLTKEAPVLFEMTDDGGENVGNESYTPFRDEPRFTLNFIISGTNVAGVRLIRKPKNTTLNLGELHNSPILDVLAIHAQPPTGSESGLEKSIVGIPAIRELNKKNIFGTSNTRELRKDASNTRAFPRTGIFRTSSANLPANDIRGGIRKMSLLNSTNEDMLQLGYVYATNKTIINKTFSFDQTEATNLTLTWNFGYDLSAVDNCSWQLFFNGVYELEAYGTAAGLWSVASTTFEIAAQFPPTQRGSSVLYTETGKEVYIECDVCASPAPTSYKWLHDSIEINDKDVRGQLSRKLHITNFQYRHYGIYGCTVINTVNTVPIRITVLQPEGLPIGLIVGLSIASLVVIAGVSAIVVFFVKRKKRSSAEPDHPTTNSSTGHLDELVEKKAIPSKIKPKPKSKPTMPCPEDCNVNGHPMVDRYPSDEAPPIPSGPRPNQRDIPAVRESEHIYEGEFMVADQGEDYDDIDTMPGVKPVDEMYLQAEGNPYEENGPSTSGYHQ